MSAPAPRTPRAVVVGGGITGLAAAWKLSQAGCQVVVLEATDQVGGKLRTGVVGGIEVDLGAESVLARRPEATGLIAALGLGDEVIAPVTTAASLRVGGVLRPLPRKTMLGVPADLDALAEAGVLSPAGLAKVAAEPRLPPLAPLREDVAVGPLVRERLGDEVADRLVEPLLGGVYAGRVDALSLQATMPALFGALAQGGSVFAAAAKVTDVGTHAPSPSGPVFASLRGGIGRLPQALAARLDVRTGTTVTAIKRTGGVPGGAVDGVLGGAGEPAPAYRVLTGPVSAPEVFTADAVLLAVPVTKAARLLAALAPRAAAELSGVETASMALSTFAFRTADLGDGLPLGSGMLVGAREGVAVKAVTVSSHKWPMRTGELTLLRASVGRAGESEILRREDGDLLAVVRRDLRALLGLTAEPVDALVTRWAAGLPQYAPGHVARVARVRAAVAQVPGLAVAGAVFDGVGIPACIASAYTAVAQLAPALGLPALGLPVPGLPA